MWGRQIPILVLFWLFRASGGVLGSSHSIRVVHGLAAEMDVAAHLAVVREYSMGHDDRFGSFFRLESLGLSISDHCYVTLGRVLDVATKSGLLVSARAWGAWVAQVHHGRVSDGISSTIGATPGFLHTSAGRKLDAATRCGNIRPSRDLHRCVRRDHSGSPCHRRVACMDRGTCATALDLSGPK